MFRLGVILALVGVSFGFKVFLAKHASGDYRMNYGGARSLCKSLGAHLATKDELEESRKAGYSSCSCGWTLDKTAHFPMTYSSPGCGSSAAVHVCDWSDKWNAYCFSGDLVGNCSKPLGVESGDISGHQMYASSEYHSWFPIFQNSKWSAQIARLHNKDLVNAWVPKYNGQHQWLEVDLKEPTAISGIVTQGASRLGKKMWVTSYVVQFGKDRHNFRTIKDGEDGSRDLVFTGNSNNDGLKRNMFPEPVLARYIRIVPHGYHRRIALRIELLGCDLEVYRSGMSEGDEEIEVTTSSSFNDVFIEREPDDA